MHRRLHSLSSCVADVMGSLSLILTSELLPDIPTDRPGAVPSNHSELRLPRHDPSMLRAPLAFSFRCFAMPLHTIRGGPVFILSSNGKSCLQVFLLLCARHALGIERSPVFGFLR